MLGAGHERSAQGAKQFMKLTPGNNTQHDEHSQDGHYTQRFEESK